MVKSVECPFNALSHSGLSFHPVRPFLRPKTRGTYLWKSNLSCFGLRLLYLCLETSQDVIRGYNHFLFLITRQLNYLCLIELVRCVRSHSTYRDKCSAAQLSFFKCNEGLHGPFMGLKEAHRADEKPKTTPLDGLTHAWRSSYKPVFFCFFWGSCKVDSFYNAQITQLNVQYRLSSWCMWQRSGQREEMDGDVVKIGILLSSFLSRLITITVAACVFASS